MWQSAQRAILWPLPLALGVITSTGLPSRSFAAAQAALHGRLALGTLQSLRLGVRVAALHLLRLAIGSRGGRARGTGRAGAGARRGLRALLGQTTLHERLALGAHQSLRLRIRTAGRHLFLLAVRLRR